MQTLFHYVKVVNPWNIHEILYGIAIRGYSTDSIGNLFDGNKYDFAGLLSTSPVASVAGHVVNQMTACTYR